MQTNLGVQVVRQVCDSLIQLLASRHGIRQVLLQGGLPQTKGGQPAQQHAKEKTENERYQRSHEISHNIHAAKDMSTNDKIENDYNKEAREVRKRKRHRRGTRYSVVHAIVRPYF